MSNCEICGLLCSEHIKIQQDAIMDLDGEIRNFLDVVYFCSLVHKYLWDIGHHTIYYSSLKDVVNHLIKYHGYDVATLQIALNLHIKRP